MIKHALKDGQIHLSIDKMDFSYRIPVKKLGNTVDWKIGKKGTKGIVIKNVSTWMLQLFTKKVTEHKYIQQFKSIVQEHCADNSINWEATLLAVNVQNNYNWLTSTNKTDKENLPTGHAEMSEDEIISTLKKKYKLK